MNIFIWGTGNFGHYIWEQIKCREDIKVKYFLDSNKEKWGTKIDNIAIISPDMIRKFYCENDVILMAFTNSIRIFEWFENQIFKVGFVRNRVFESKMKLGHNLLEDRNILWNDDAILEKPMLQSLETNIVDGCNLNCRGCSHFSNLFRKDEKVDFETFCNDLTQIANHVYIYRFNMLGGEALLNDRIVEYIDFAANLMPYTDIELISNGLLIPNQSEAFFECCKKNDIVIGISGYKPTLRMKDKIVQVLEEHGVNYIFRQQVDDFGKNIDLSGNNIAEETVKRCRENRCHFMRRGKIYKCPFEALGNKLFSYFDIDIQIDGGIDIYDDGLEWKQAVKILHDNPVEACRYCGKEERIEWKIANVPMLEDWIV